MKRDMDLIRKLALHVEEISDYTQSSSIQIADYPSDAIMYHCQLMSDAGLIESETSMRPDPRFYDLLVSRLSWAGHEFVDAARNDTVWNKVTSHVKESATSISFDALKGLLRQAAQQAMARGIEWLSTTDWHWLQLT